MKMNFSETELIIYQAESGLFVFEERYLGRPVYAILFDSLLFAIEKLHDVAFDYLID